MEEREAVARLRRRDVDGLEYLVRAHQVRAVRAAYLVTHDLGLAQDVVQEAFLKAYDRIGQFDASRPFAPWFMTSVLRDAAKAARRQQRHRSIEADAERGDGGEHLTDSGPGPEALLEASETGEEVRIALLALTPDQRAAVVARYYLGMGEAEMSATLSCTTSTVKWRLYSARQRLRALLSPPAGERQMRGSAKADPRRETGAL